MCMNINELLAKHDGTTLLSHTAAVKNLAVAMCKHCNLDDKFIMKCATSAVLHDIGKCTSKFQSLVNSSAEEIPSNTYIHHSIISWSVCLCCFNNNMTIRQIANAVLYHHAIQYHEGLFTKAFDVYNTLSDNEKSAIRSFYNSFDGVLPMSDEIEESTADCLNVPLFDITKTNNRTSVNDEECCLLRSILVASDRIVSSNEYDNTRIEANDTSYMQDIISSSYAITALNNYDITANLAKNYDMIRLSEQINIVDDVITGLNENKNSVIVSASAGFGKTLLGLISIIKRKKKTIWCVPTREIAISTFSSICAELQKMNCPLSVCLFYGNEIQNTNSENNNHTNIKSYDIVVSVIDSMLSKFYKNNDAHLLYSLFTSDAIFDEYHNVVTNNALFAAASVLWNTRSLLTNAYSLFLSATPLEYVNAGIKRKDNIRIINPPKYKGDIKINLKYIGDMTAHNHFLPNSFVITNTVAQSQHMYRKIKALGYENVILFHSQFSESDKSKIRKKVFDNFGKNTSESDMIVVCTGIIGTGLDISAKNIYDYTLTPSDTLQRVCGRASRFGEYDEINYFVCDIKDTDAGNIGKGNDMFIQNAYDVKLRTSFLNMLKHYDNTTITKNDLYDIVKTFNKQNEKRIYEYYTNVLECSRENLSKITLKKSKKSKDTSTKYTSKQVSLRGNGKEIFVAIKYEKSYILFTMDSDRIRRIEREPDDIDVRKFRMKFYKDNKIFQKSWKYRYGIKDYSTCNFDTCVDLAYCSDTPLPVHNMNYSSEIGAYEAS